MIQTKSEKTFLWYFLILIVLSLAVSPAFALGDGNRNLLLLGVMSLSPLVLILQLKFYRSEMLLWLFLLSIVLIPLIHQPQSMRWSTVMYSWMFGLTFMAYNRLLHRNMFSIEQYKSLLKYLIYAYFVVLVIQQVSVLAHIPVFNLSNYNPSEPFKLNSLAAEPSHSARIVALLMYCYIIVQEIIAKQTYNFRDKLQEDKWVWFGFLWTMLTMGSGTAFIFTGIVLLKFMRFRNVLALMMIFVAIIFLINLFGITAFDRTFTFAMATLTLDPDIIMHADHSASFRIVPIILLVEMVDLSTMNGWFGHGIDFVSTFLSSKMYGAPEGISGGGTLQLLTEYGFLAFSFFMAFSLLSFYRKGDYLSVVFWFMLVFLNAINTQIVWLTIILLFTNTYFIRIGRK